MQKTIVSTPYTPFSKQTYMHEYKRIGVKEYYDTQATYGEGEVFWCTCDGDMKEVVSIDKNQKGTIYFIEYPSWNYNAIKEMAPDDDLWVAL